jgi:hypothetical protein
MRHLLGLLAIVACDGGAPAVVDSAPGDTAVIADAPIDAPGGPNVDRTDPKLHAFDFTAAEADPEATQALGHQLGYLDTRIEPRGLLVVYLHGAITVNANTTCGSRAHGEVLAGMGFHTLHPCYRADYGIGNCDGDIRACRFEAFEGTDHSAAIAIAPANAIEPRVVAALRHLHATHPGGDWAYYLDGDRPRWSRIIISGHSHGASTSALIGKLRTVERVVSLAGPLDSGQPWLTESSLTPLDRFYAFTHAADGQHPGHLTSFEALGLPGAPTTVDDALPPFDGSHRLTSSVTVTDGHGAVQAGGSSPKLGDGSYRYLPAWRQLYGAP